MVEYTINIDTVFSSLADATRRDILSRVLRQSQSIGELAESYKHLSFAAVAKHIGVLEAAKLITKKKEGRYQIITANPKVLAAAERVLQEYQAAWESRFNTLDTLLKE
jgi:DNA-binding transcriptional ArsR family regulator